MKTNRTNKLLAVIIALQGLMLIGQWTGNTSYLPTAHAEVPDPGARQMQMIEALKSIDGKLDTIVSVLQGGELQVKVAKTEETKGATRAK
jgi:hypothetical protein